MQLSVYRSIHLSRTSELPLPLRLGQQGCHEHESQKKEPYPLGLELYMVVRHHVGARDQT